MAISNDGNIVKRTSQYIDNESFNETTGLRVTEIGGSDGAQVNTAKVNSDGSVDVTVVAGGSAAANYTTKIDDTTTANMVYIGKAALTGSAVATSAASWQIKRIDTSTLAMDKKWADGNDSFDNIWDSRSSLTYN
jgi:hypothetical protein